MAQEAKDHRRRLDSASRVDLSRNVGINDARSKPVQISLLQRGASRLLTVIGPAVESDLRHTSVGAVDHPAWAVVVRRIAVSLGMHMPHLNKTVVGVAIEILASLKEQRTGVKSFVDDWRSL